MSINTLNALWQEKKYEEFGRSLTASIVINKLTKLWDILKDDPHRAIKVLQDVQSAELIVILLHIYIMLRSKKQQQHTVDLFFDYMYKLDFWLRTFPQYFLKIWNLTQTWEIHNKTLYFKFCKHILEDVITQEDIIPDDNPIIKEKVLTVFETIYVMMIDIIPLGDRITMLVYLIIDHDDDDTIQKTVCNCITSDSQVRAHMVDFVIQIQRTDLSPCIVDLLTEEDRRVIFERYKTELVRALSSKNRYRYNELQRLRPLAQWSLSLIHRTVEQQQQRRLTRDIIRTRNFQTIQNVIDHVQRLERDRRHGQKIDPVFLNDLENYIRKTIVRNETLKRALINRIRRYRKNKFI